jgi:hypothetical protein
MDCFRVDNYFGIVELQLELELKLRFLSDRV